MMAADCDFVDISTDFDKKKRQAVAVTVWRFESKYQIACSNIFLRHFLAHIRVDTSATEELGFF